MNEHDACKICFDEGIEVYPVIVGKNHQIEYTKNGIIQKRYSKLLTTPKKVNDAMSKTYIFLAKKIMGRETIK